MADKSPMAVAEEPSEDGAQRRGQETKPGLPADPIGDFAAALERLEGPFVFPRTLAQHRRALEEALARVEAGKADVVVVEGEQAEEQNPAAADPLADLDFNWIDAFQPARQSHPQVRPHLVVDPSRRRHPVPHHRGARGDTGGDSYLGRARNSSGSSITVLTKSPMPSISTRTVSPTWSRFSRTGWRPRPTPDGVPVAITSPGSRVKASER